MTMPAQKPGRSKQDYGTPAEFIAAVEKRWGWMAVDLAASKENAKAPSYYTEADDSLAQNWQMLFRNPATLCCWLNPPFGDVEPWARKCASAQLWPSQRILLLTPASVGANWFINHVIGKAAIYALSPRLTFEGAKDPFPRDCCLSVYGETPGFSAWRWK